MYKCKGFMNNGNFVKPLKGLLKGAPGKLAILAMVTIVASAVFLGMASANPDPSTTDTTITGNVVGKIKLTAPSTLNFVAIDPDKDGVGGNPTNDQTGTLRVKSNTPDLGWQVMVIDNSVANKGHLRKTTGSTTTQLTNPLHVKAGNYDRNLESTTPQVIASGTQTTGTDVSVTFSQAGSYSDTLGNGYSIVVAFSASLIASLPEE
jgi:hypothetical protein